MIEVSNIQKIYGRGSALTHALRGVTLTVAPGEFVAIMGRSGSGKSTLLHILGLLDSPTKGTFQVEGRDMLQLTENERARFRLGEFGYVFQEYSLLPGMTLLENVFVPALGLGRGNHVRKRATAILETVGLGDRLKHHPGEVSGGEQQRAAVARALINEPRVLFADEPTASLDVASAEVVLSLFRQLNRDRGQTIVMVTHEPEDAKCADRVIWLKDGLVDEAGDGSIASGQ